MVARDLLDEAITKFLEWRAFSYGSGFVSRPPAPCRALLPPYFKSAVRAFWNTQRPMRDSIQANGVLWLRLLEWRTKSCSKLLLLRLAPRARLLCECAILGWISFGRHLEAVPSGMELQPLLSFRASKSWRGVRTPIR